MSSFPPFVTLDDPARSFAASRPTAPALRDDHEALDWRALDSRLDRWARALLHFGLERGQRVALIGSDSVGLISAALGVARARGVMVCINPKLVTPEVAYMIEDAQARILILDSEWAGRADEIRAACPSIEAVVILGGADSNGETSFLAAAPADLALPQGDVAGEELVSLNYTSGTTGKPKGVMLAHRSFFAVRRSLADHADPWIGWSPEDRSLSLIPFFHIGGIWWVMTTMISGAQVRLIPTFAPRAALEVLESERITKACMVPAMMGMCLQDPSAAGRAYDALDCIVYGGSPIPVSVLEHGQRVFQCGFAQIYGLTETGNTAVCLRPEDHRADRRDLLRAAGRPYPGVEAKVIDDEGQTLEAGETGQICLKSPANMLGYWNKPEATAETLRDGWIHTGDGGIVDPEGYVFVGDRLKDMIICAGENIFPAEVESALVEHADVLEAGVIGEPDPRWGETVTAIVVPRPESGLRNADLLKHLKGRIANFKIPRRILFAAALPRTPSGKIQKHALRAQYLEER